MLKTSVSQAQTIPQPVSLVEAKDQLSWAQSDDSQDDRISRLIMAATEQWEHDTQTVTTVRTVTEQLPCFPLPTWRFYFRPLMSLDIVTYFDSSNIEQTLDPSVYSVDYPNRKLFLAVGASWPDVQERWDAVKLTYTGGQITVDEICKQAILIQIDIMEELRGLSPKDKDASVRAYENIVNRYMRASYP